MNPDNYDLIKHAMSERSVLRAATTKSPWLQKFHFMPPGGWLNDPNGLIFFNDMFHLFYQHNPYGTTWSQMYWGHAQSKDLIKWEHLPIAIAPSHSYDNHPNGGVFSGTSVKHDDKLHAFYTAGSVCSNEPKQMQCLAISTDCGLSYKKYYNNPIISKPPEGISSDFRDPKVFMHKDKWYMLVGASTGTGATSGGDGCALMYESDNLVGWSYRGIIARSNGCFGSMWECPDFFQINGKWILTFSPMFCGNKKAIYLVGDMNFDEAEFKWSQWSELDLGFDYYAPQTMEDAKGRIIQIAWQNGWEWMNDWKSFGPTGEDGWCGNMTFPRVIDLDSDNNIISQPVEELEKYRSDFQCEADLSVGTQKHYINCKNNIHFEMRIGIDIHKSTATKFAIILRSSNDRLTKIEFDLSKAQILFDRNKSDDNYSHGICQAKLHLDQELLDIIILSDTTSIEIFAENGKTCISSRIYPKNSEQKSYICSSDGFITVRYIKTWSLEIS
jgi:beta-fructofuranosidase